MVLNWVMEVMKVEMAKTMEIQDFKVAEMVVLMREVKQMEIIIMWDEMFLLDVVVVMDE